MSRAGDRAGPATLSVLAVRRPDGHWTWTASTATPGTREPPRIIASHLAARPTLIVLDELLQTAWATARTATPAERLPE